MAFDGPEAKQLNKDIFECIYYNALVTSCALAKENGECTLATTLAMLLDSTDTTLLIDRLDSSSGQSEVHVLCFGGFETVMLSVKQQQHFFPMLQ